MSTQKFTAILVDDEDNARNLLQRIIKDYFKEVDVVGTASSAKEGLQLANDKKPDILFLDIEMPGGTGIGLTEGLIYSPFIIFVTAYEHYAIKAIKAGAFDYLLKPIDIDDLQKTIQKIKSKNNSGSEIKENIKSLEQKSNLVLPVKEGVLYIKQNEILKLEADGSYCTIYLKNNQKHIVSKNLKEISEQLNSQLFFRCHASYVINIEEVSKLLKTEGTFVQLSDSSKVPVSRKYKDDFLELMEKRLQ